MFEPTLPLWGVTSACVLGCCEQPLDSQPESATLLEQEVHTLLLLLASKHGVASAKQ